MYAYLEKKLVRPQISGFISSSINVSTAVPQVQIDIALNRIQELRNMSSNGIDPCMPTSPVLQVRIPASHIYIYHWLTILAGQHRYQLHDITS